MRRWSSRATLAAVAAALAVVTALLPAQTASADVIFSQFDPPPLCSVAPPGEGCIAQPNEARYIYEPGIPILIDMPTMRIDINETFTGGVPALEDVTGIVTFTITDGGSTVSPYSFQEGNGRKFPPLLPDSRHVGPHRVPPHDVSEAVGDRRNPR